MMSIMLKDCVVFTLILLFGGCLPLQCSRNSSESGIDKENPPPEDQITRELDNNGTITGLDSTATFSDVLQHRPKRAIGEEDKLLKQAMEKAADMIVKQIPSKMDDLNMKITARILDKIGNITYNVPAGKEYATKEALQIGSILTQGRGLAILAAKKKQQVAVAFFTLEILKMGLEFSDAGGYSKMGTVEKYMQMKERIDNYLDKILRKQGATYPSVVGPLDKLSDKNFEEKLREQVIATMKPENNDPLVEVMLMKLQEDIKDGKIKTSDINSRKMKMYLFFVDVDRVLSKAMDSICKQQGGKVVKVRSKDFRCSYKDRSTCQSSYNLPLSKGDVYAEYNSDLFGGSCLHASYALRALCEGNNLGYDTGSGLCQINETYCKIKGAEWEMNKNIGKNDCTIPKPQEIFETVFGKTIVRGVKQLFDPRQYKSCMSNETDDGYFCRNVSCSKGEEQWENGGICYKKCKEGFHPFGCCICSPDCKKGFIDDGAFCRKADSCPSDKEHQGGLCYKKCKDGFKGVGPVCYEECKSGYEDKGVFCLRSMNVYAKKSRPADKKPCPKGLRDDGMSCWKDAYGRGVGRVPDKTKCPPRHRDDGTSCWLDSYGRGAGRFPDKAPCPNGLRDDGTSCWSDAHIYGNGCRGGCRRGYHNDGCTCRKVDVGIKLNLWQRQRCRNGEEKNGGLCYPKCAPGYHAVGCCICQPRGGPGIKVTLGQRQVCRDNEERNGALCYPKCKEGYRPVGCCLCTPNEGAGIKVPIDKRLYCKDNENMVAGICYEKCKTGFTDDGVICRDSYTKESYGRGVGTPGIHIKAKADGYGRGVGTSAVHIRAKERLVSLSTKENF